MTTTLKDKRLLVPDTIRRRAGIKAGDGVEFRVSGGIISIIPVLPSADDEYTPGQRSIIDAQLAESQVDLNAGRVHGPFGTADEMIADMKHELKKRSSAKKRHRPSE